MATSFGRFGSVRLRFTLAAAILAAAAVGAVLWLREGALAGFRAAETAQLRGVAEQVDHRLRELEREERGRLWAMGLRDEAYALLNLPADRRRDTTLARAFLGALPAQHGYRFVAVYGVDGTPRVRWVDPRWEDPTPAIAISAVFRMLDSREPTAGVLRTRRELLLVGGTPILPANPGSSRIRGYLVVAQPFGPAQELGLLGELRSGARLEPLEPGREPYGVRIATTVGDSVTVRFALADLFAQQTTLVTFTTSRGAWSGAERRLTARFAVVVAGLLAAGLLVVLLVYRDLLVPLRRLAEAAPGVLPAVSQAEEWQAVTGGVNRRLYALRAEPPSRPVPAWPPPAAGLEPAERSAPPPALAPKATAPAAAPRPAAPPAPATAPEAPPRLAPQAAPAGLPPLDLDIGEFAGIRMVEVDDAPPIDPDRLEQLRVVQAGTGSRLGNELVAVFLGEAPARLATISAALESGRRGVGVEAATDLEGMARLVGAGRLAEACSVLGEAVGDGGGAAAAELVERTARELARATRALEGFVTVTSD